MYTVLSLSPNVSIELHAVGSQCLVIANRNTLYISVGLNQTCPPGFTISVSEKLCVCEPRLVQYTNSRTITNGVGRVAHGSGQQIWIGFDDQSQSDVLIFHPLCPFDYCVIINYFLLTRVTCSVQTTGQASCVDVARMVTVCC